MNILCTVKLCKRHVQKWMTCDQYFKVNFKACYSHPSAYVFFKSIRSCFRKYSVVQRCDFGEMEPRHRCCRHCWSCSPSHRTVSPLLAPPGSPQPGASAVAICQPGAPPFPLHGLAMASSLSIVSSGSLSWFPSVRIKPLLAVSCYTFASQLVVTRACNTGLPHRLHTLRRGNARGVHLLCRPLCRA